MEQATNGMSYFDNVVEDSEATPLSPQFRPEGLETHATSAPGSGPSRRRPAYANDSFPAFAASRTTNPNPNIPGPSVFPAAPSSYAMSTTVQPQSPYFQIGATSVDWPPSGQNSMYGSDASPGMSTSSGNIFDYNQDGQAQGQRPSFEEYVAPSNIENAQGSFDFGYPWVIGEANAKGNASSNPRLGLSISLRDNFTPGGEHFGEQSDGTERANSDVEAESAAYQPTDLDLTGRLQRKRIRTSPPGAMVPAQSSKRASFSSQETGSSGGSGGIGMPKPVNKLRSASRTSKNAHHRPLETAEERKSRNSHNLVEKQYRNRLNAQFESLLNALPDTIRGLNPTGGDDSDIPNFDSSEKRISKAEVLDMARQHITILERERNAFEHERNELLSSLKQLREEYANGLERLDRTGAGEGYGESTN